MREALTSFPMPARIPDRVACICVHGAPLYWKKAWLIARLAHWNGRLPAAKFLPYDLLPTDPNLILHLNAAQNDSFQKELQYILPILTATPIQEGPSGVQAGLSPVIPVQPAASILMSIHNMKDTLGWSIRSVLAQTNGNWELLIGDDGSEDESLEEACSYHDGRIRVLSQRHNRGKAMMMNRLLFEAKGRYILELDGDDWLAPNAVALLTEVLDANPHGGIATGWYGCWERTRQFGPLWRRDVDSGKLHSELSTPLSDPSSERSHPIVPRMYRKSSLISIEGWWNREDRFGRIFEDMDVTSRLLKHSFLVHVTAVLYHRVIYGGSISQRNRDLFQTWNRQSNKS